MKACICSLFLLIALLCACDTAAPSASPLTTIRIGVCLYRQDDTFISLLTGELIEQAKRIEQEENVKLVITVKDGQGSQSLQEKQASSLLEKGYDVLLINVVDRTSVARLVDYAKALDVPLVFFNREPVEEDLLRSQRVCYVGADAVQSGQLQGSLLVEAWQTDPTRLDRNGDGKLQYVMLEGDLGHQDALLRTESVISTLSEAGIATDKLATGIANWLRVQANAKMALWIEKYGDQIEAVISNNDEMALGALDALQTAGVNPLPAVVGIDGTPAALAAVQSGQMLGTVYNDAEGQAYAVLQTAFAMARGQPIPHQSKYLYLPYIRITPANVAYYMSEE